MVVNPLSVDGLPFRVPKDGSQAGRTSHAVKTHTPHMRKRGSCLDMLNDELRLALIPENERLTLD